MRALSNDLPAAAADSLNFPKAQQHGDDENEKGAKMQKIKTAELRQNILILK